MIEIKDLLGLSQPLTKLVEVAAEGIGAISRPFLTRKNADASAYKIKTLAKVVAESPLLAEKLRYDDGEVAIESLVPDSTPGLPEAPIEERILARIIYQDTKKQFNTERIVQYAAEELSAESEVSSEEVNPDWISRFFKIAEDITTEEMQALWGKILAGEVKRPKSYSLRTLDVLKNITQEEAELFVEAGHWAITDQQKAWLLFDSPEESEKMTGITFLKRAALIEIGLLATEPSHFTMFEATEKEWNVFVCGSTVIYIRREKGTPKQRCREILFTEAGRQLLSLVEKKPADIDYIRKFASNFRRDGVSIKYAQIDHWMPNGQFFHDPEQDLFFDTP